MHMIEVLHIKQLALREPLLVGSVVNLVVSEFMSQNCLVLYQPSIHQMEQIPSVIQSSRAERPAPVHGEVSAVVDSR